LEQAVGNALQAIVGGLHPILQGIIIIVLQTARDKYPLKSLKGSKLGGALGAGQK